MSGKELTQPCSSGLGKKQKKSKLLNEKALEQKRLKEREKKRRQREKLKQNKEAHEKYKEKEREMYMKKKEMGKVKLISDLTPREQRKRRKEWKIRQQKCRQARKAGTDNITMTPPSSSVLQGSESRKKRGRKKVRKERSALFRTLKKCEAEVHRYKARAERYKKRLQRINKNTASPSPKKKVNMLLKSSPRCVIQRKLLFGEAMLAELKDKSKKCTLEKDKKMLTNMISGKILRKYKLLQEAKQFLSRRQLSHIGNIRNQRKSKSTLPRVTELVTKFLQDDINSSFTPGKRDFITKNKVRMQKRILLDSLKNLHRKFNKRSNLKVSYATFCKVKPFWFVHQDINKRDTCLCIKHANF